MNNHTKGKKKNKNNTKENEDPQETDSDETNHYGILPNHDIKKNLGCGG
ncbi:hypothetical protein LVD15_07240 [Fulvivirga maritima]|nr:hypothetical protein [Fulvivirga maritima]UII28212.1 hypothetical protein LVD15_07240 [Fulvivirga maritima]